MQTKLLLARLITILFGICSCLLSSSVYASAPEDNGFVRQIAEGVFLHQGPHVGLEHHARGDSANIGFVVGENCVAVIDTGGSLATGRQLRDAIIATTSTPICYVINTHVHFDHVLGNAAFAQDSPTFVGHKNLKDAILGNRGFFVEEFSTELGSTDESAVVAPTLLVEDERKIDLGNRELILQAVAPAHTDADLTVYDAKTKLLWTGDLVSRERMPILDASLKGWLAWLAAERDAVKVIPGHGSAGADWQTSTQPIKSYLQALLDDTRKAIADGVFLEEAHEHVGVKAAAEWQLNDRHARNVSRAYRQLEWE
ncbi:MAG: quinoprotein relay system zinc metallohydrolase 2 [Pseudomonadota bacterium]